MSSPQDPPQVLVVEDNAGVRASVGRRVHRADENVAARAVNEGQVHAFFGKPALGEDFERRVKELIATHVEARAGPFS